MIVNQGAVIDLQKELTTANDTQLQELKKLVVTSVEGTVKSDMKSQQCGLEFCEVIRYIVVRPTYSENCRE